MAEDRVNVQASSDQTDWFELACKLVFVFIFCVFVSFIAGFTSSLFWHAHYEPFLYPCPDANQGGLCEYKHQTPPSRDEPILFYS